MKLLCEFCEKEATAVGVRSDTLYQMPNLQSMRHVIYPLCRDHLLTPIEVVAELRYLDDIPEEED